MAILVREEFAPSDAEADLNEQTDDGNLDDLRRDLNRGHPRNEREVEHLQRYHTHAHTHTHTHIHDQRSSVDGR